MFVLFKYWLFYRRPAPSADSFAFRTERVELPVAPPFDVSPIRFFPPPSRNSLLLSWSFLEAVSPAFLPLESKALLSCLPSLPHLPFFFFLQDPKCLALTPLFSFLSSPRRGGTRLLDRSWCFSSYAVVITRSI